MNNDTRAQIDYTTTGGVTRYKSLQPPVSSSSSSTFPIDNVTPLIHPLFPSHPNPMMHQPARSNPGSYMVDYITNPGFRSTMINTANNTATNYSINNNYNQNANNIAAIQNSNNNINSNNQVHYAKLGTTAKAHVASFSLQEKFGKIDNNLPPGMPPMPTPSLQYDLPYEIHNIPIVPSLLWNLVYRSGGFEKANQYDAWNDIAAAHFDIHMINKNTYGSATKQIYQHYDHTAELKNIFMKYFCQPFDSNPGQSVQEMNRTLPQPQPTHSSLSSFSSPSSTSSSSSSSSTNMKQQKDQVHHREPYLNTQLKTGKYFKRRERASRIWKHAVVDISMTLWLTFLFLLPLSDLFHCIYHVSSLF